MQCPLRGRAAVGSVMHASVSGRPTQAQGVVAGQQWRTVAYAYDSAGGTSTTTSDAVAALGASNIKVTPPRPLSVPPSPPRLIHSPAYTQKELIRPSGKATAVLPPAPSTSSAATRGRASDDEEEESPQNANVLMSALKQVDRSLDELEHNPLPMQKEMYEFSRSPVGTATSSALTTAAKVTVAATKEAVRAAVPVGKWMFEEGTKAAVSLMSRAMAETARRQAEGGSSTGTAKVAVGKKGKEEAAGGESGKKK